MAEHVPGKPYRYRHGWIPLRYPEIHKTDLSTPDARRSRAVSASEFQHIAAKGAAQYEQLKRKGSPTTGLDKNWNSIVNRAYTESRADWGGSTIDSHTGEFLPQGADKYALTVRDKGMSTVSVPRNASLPQFRKAMNEAKVKYADILKRQDHHLGVFNNVDTNRIEIDPVLVTGNKEHTETIGAYTRAVGGAYHFQSGLGFWPPHVADLSKKGAA